MIYYVYILKSINFPDKIYIGYTLDISSRLQKHNEGGSIYTKDHRPWEMVWHCTFLDKSKALEFEKYLKSHSGRAFAQKRLVAISYSRVQSACPS